MSLERPHSGAERVAAQRGRSPFVAKQLVVLVVGAAAAATIAATLVSVDGRTNPIWVLPVIASGFVAFLGLLASTAWSAHGALGQARPPLVGGARYLVVLLLAATVAVVVTAGDPPPAAWIAPLVLALVVACLAMLAARRRADRARARARLRRGMRVAGTVTDDGLAEFPSTPNVKLATLTVSFVDSAGAERWISPRALQDPSRPITVGQQVDVWFDPAAPGETDRILAEHDNGASRLLGALDRPGAP